MSIKIHYNINFNILNHEKSNFKVWKSFNKIGTKGY